MDDAQSSAQILIVVRNYDGGTGTFVNQMTNMLGSQFGVLSLFQPKYVSPSVQDRVWYVHKKAITDDQSNMISLKFLREFFMLLSIVRVTKPKVLLSIDTHCNVLVCLIKIFFVPQSKILITTHNNVSAVFKHKLTLVDRRIVRKFCSVVFGVADACVCVSKGVASDFIQYFSYKKKVHVIYYGVDVPPLVKTTKFHENKDVCILSVSRLDSQKDFPTLLDAFEQIYRKNKHARLLVVGDGKEKKKINRYFANYSSRAHVSFLSWKQRLRPYYLKADVFVLSSHYEGFPYVLLEAMSYGLPIVASDVDYGPRELLAQGRFGFLVKPGDSSDMAHKITMALHPSTNKKYTILSKKRILHFSKEKMFDAYRKLVSSLL